MVLGTPHVFSVDARTHALLRSRLPGAVRTRALLSRRGAGSHARCHVRTGVQGEEELARAEQLAALADYCVFRPDRDTPRSPLVAWLRARGRGARHRGARPAADAELGDVACGPAALLAAVARRDPLQRPFLSEPAARLLQWLLQWEAARRPTAAQALQHVRAAQRCVALLRSSRKPACAGVLRGRRACHHPCSAA